MPRAQGQHTAFDAKKNEASGQFRIWRSMRILRRFTIDELTTTVETATRNTVYTYLTRLREADYVVAEQRPSHKLNRPAIYRLVRDTGPYAPMVRRDRTVFDPNSNKVFGEARS